MTPSGGTVSLLFTDLVGSTALMGQIGDEPAEALRRAHYRLLRQAVADHGGHEAKNLGDGLMVVFDSATSAVACAVAIQRSVRRHNERQEHPMDVRVGINVGEPIRSEEDYFGWSVLTARRLCDHADGGQVLVSEVVAQLARPGDDFNFASVGSLRLGTGDREVPTFAVTWRDAPGELLPLPTPVRDREPATFVGREGDLGRLRLDWARALEGERQLVLVGAEPGMGKTTLVMQAARELQASGAAVLYGRCEEETLISYQPFVEAIRDYIAACPVTELNEHVRPVASDLIRLVPELAARLPGIEPPPELASEEARYRLFEAFRRFFAAVSATWPVLLVIEDLHWVDRGSLLLLQFLARELGQSRLMILGTYRDSEVDRRHPLTAAMVAMRRDLNVQRIFLTGLSMDEVADLIEASAGHDLDERGLAAVRAVHQETEGHPLFVHEIYRHLSETGRIGFESGRWVSDIRSARDIAVPEGVRATIGLRLARLSPDAADTLTLASVIGAEFSLPVLRSVAGLDEGRLIDLLEEAVAGHLLDEAADRPGTFRFSHILVRDALYSDLSRTRRSRLHQQLAGAIEAALEKPPLGHINGARTRASAAQLAYHLTEAAAPGSEEKTAHFLGVAADDARAATAYEDAQRYYQQALDLLPPQSPAGPRLLFGLGLAQRDLGMWEVALDTWREAISAGTRLGDAATVGRVAWDVCYQLIWAGRHLECLEIAGLGLSVLGDAESVDRGHLLGLTGSLFGFAGNHEAGAEMIQETLDMAERLDDDELRGNAQTLLTGFHFAFLQFPETIESGRGAAAISRRLGDPWNLGTDLSLLRYALVHTGRLEEARDLTDELKTLIDRHGHHGAELLYNRGEMALVAMTGDHEEFRRRAEDDLVICERAGFAWTDTGHAFLAAAAYMRGDWQDAEAHYRVAVDTEVPSFTSGLAAGGLFRHLAYMGEEDAAMEVYRTLRHDIAEPGPANAIGRWVALLGAVEGFNVLGRHAEAAAFAPMMERLLEMGVAMNGFDAGLTRTVAGICQASAERWDEAEAHFGEALGLADALPHRVEQADIRRHRAAMLRRRGATGDASLAGTLLDEAAAIYQELRMPRHVELTKRY